MIHVFIILILYDNRILSTEICTSRKNAEAKAIQLSNEWYKKDGIEAYGKHQLETFDEIQNYYRSNAYLESNDGAHICIEEVVLRNLQ